ncbi:capsular polysaccharide synthesis protein [Acinetobacter sp. ANC 7201]|uniref:glycosyltransferase family 32 protein n=1 Tax=Acinetobacter sp. ANC 7201 TaxID=3035288 RepID=UPI00279CB491|nr:capsular polysaccharide synthesis protein [Acinetobacter sp. ANC 7201]WFP96568.1 capsular polysaccharide synthesis protein [Acinetobacter sp. ANC 7201]
MKYKLNHFLNSASIINKFRIITLYFFIFLKFNIQSLEPNENPKKEIKKGLKNTEIPKKIWVYWHEKKLPKVIEICVERIKRLNPDYEFFLLNDGNLNDFVEGLNDFEFLKVQHKSDYIRLFLLENYGGVWMDASILTFSSIDVFTKALEENHAGFFAFFNEKRTTDFEYPIIESWFVAAEKNNTFIHSWFNDFKYALKIGPEIYINSIYDKDVFHNIDTDERVYLIVYICAQVALRKYDGSYVLWSCDDTAFYYHLTGSFRYLLYKKETFHYTNIIKTLALYKRPNRLPVLIKLVSGDYKHLEKVIEKKYYRKNSMLGICIRDQK